MSGKMTKIFLTLLCLMSAGCAHKEFICGYAAFIFVEADRHDFSVNFRDDRLLKSDIILSGQIQKWTPGPLWKASGYFSIAAEIESKEEIFDVQLALVRSSAGDPSYLSTTVFQSDDLVGKAKITPLELGGISPDTKLILHFKIKIGEDKFKLTRELEIAKLLPAEANQQSK